MARPRLDKQERRARTVGVRVTAAEEAELRERAQAARLSMGAYLRRRALGERVRMAAELRLGAAELRELNRIGVNLNQMARALNSRAVSSPAETQAEPLVWSCSGGVREWAERMGGSMSVELIGIVTVGVALAGVILTSSRGLLNRAYASPRNFLVEGIGVCGNTNINISAPQCDLDGSHDNILREEARHGREVEGLPWRGFRTRLHVLNELAGLRGNLHSPVVAVAAHVVLDTPMKAGSDDKNRCLRGWQVSRC